MILFECFAMYAFAHTKIIQLNIKWEAICDEIYSFKRNSIEFFFFIFIICSCQTSSYTCSYTCKVINHEKNEIKTIQSVTNEIVCQIEGARKEGRYHVFEKNKTLLSVKAIEINFAHNWAIKFVCIRRTSFHEKAIARELL